MAEQSLDDSNYEATPLTDGSYCCIKDSKIYLHINETTRERCQIVAAMATGALLIDHRANDLLITSDTCFAADNGSDADNNAFLQNLSDSILQAARIRFTKTEYISCPGCGRTLYNLRDTIAKIKAATSHLIGVKIGIMGCIVNGPGEMADADYGYVGAGRGRISLYKKKECIEKNIPEEEAVERLLQLINSDIGNA